MHTALRRNLLFVVLVFIVATNVSAQIVSNFTTNDEGWTVFITSSGTSVAPTYNATGGNPANSGEISYSTLSTAVGFYFTAPAKFKGDLSAAYNQNFTFDLHTSYPGSDNSIGDVIITNSAVAGASLYYQLPGKPPYMGYSFGGNYSIQLVETFAGWHYGSMTGATPTAAQMKLVLGNVTNLQIREKYYTGNTFAVNGYLDNVSVVLAPPTVTTQPTTPQTVCAETNVTLTTAATGNPNITYRWQLFNTSTGAYNDLNNNTVYSNVATSSLLINTTGAAGAGTYRCRISGSYVADVYSNTAVVNVNAKPNAPVTTGASGCNPSSITLTAAGASNGQYRWYTAATGGTAIASQNNSTYATPSLSATTIYYVAINNGTCESNRTAVTATISNPPTTTGGFTCTTTTGVILTAAGAANGQYRWYTVATGGSAISNATNATYTTPAIAATTTFYVAINNGTCETNRTAVTATLGGSSCPSNEPPVIASTPITAPIEGKVTLNLANPNLISDKDGNLDISTLKVIVSPSSGATATIDSKSNLILDYTGISFSGTEKLTIQVCDFAGACTQRELNIEVTGDIIVYNAISPNNDGKNEFLFLEYIEVLPDTKKNKVSIFGRWGDVVFDVEDYNNTTKIFKGLNNNGNELPSGTYFYKIEFTSSHKPVTGYLTLKR